MLAVTVMILMSPQILSIHHAQALRTLPLIFTRPGQAGVIASFGQMGK